MPNGGIMALDAATGVVVVAATGAAATTMALATTMVRIDATGVVGGAATGVVVIIGEQPVRHQRQDARANLR
jgi:hypothetical protein